MWGAWSRGAREGEGQRRERVRELWGQTGGGLEETGEELRETEQDSNCQGRGARLDVEVYALGGQEPGRAAGGPKAASV